MRESFNVLLPPAVGFRLSLILKLLARNRVKPKYYFRAFLTLLINIINAPFRLYERLFINPRIARVRVPDDPIFIIGHWRSGTTHLHNLLSQDKQMGYVTTYQGVFPDTMFTWLGKLIFKNFMSLLIPSTRKGDNVKLDPEFPQEEEFIPGMHIPFCFYYYWMFPRKIMEYYDRYVRLNGTSDKMMKAWSSEYLMLIKKALKNTGRTKYVSKNPTNTGRIPHLLKIFPHAKFIHIHRNPVEVYISTKHFLSKLLPFLQLNELTVEELKENILYIYKEIMAQFIHDKPLIPKGHFIEIRFEDLETDPLREVGKIYDSFNIPGKEQAMEEMRSYLIETKEYQRNKHFIRKEELQKVLETCGFAMERWHYKVPDELTITD